MASVIITDDFDLDKIAESGQCFRWHKMKDGGYRIQAGERMLIIREAGSDLYEVSEWDSFWENYFDLDTHYKEIRSRIPADDRYLYAAAEAGKGIRILRQDPWETLITFIISQRKSIPAIRTCVEKLCAAAGRPITETGFSFPMHDNPASPDACIKCEPGRKTHAFTMPDKPDSAPSESGQDTEAYGFRAFPMPEELASLSMEDLLACGLGYRAKYIAAVAEQSLHMEEMKTLDDEALLRELMRLPGVGIKVASCTMLFGFHRLNLFPEDVWISRVLKEHYPDGFPFARYAPFCGVMQQYLFYYRRNFQNSPDRRAHNKGTS